MVFILFTGYNFCPPIQALAFPFGFLSFSGPPSPSRIFGFLPASFNALSNIHSTCPFTLLKSSAAHFSSASYIWGDSLSTKFFFSAMSGVDELTSWKVDELTSWKVDELTSWKVDELTNQPVNQSTKKSGMQRSGIQNRARCSFAAKHYQ